MSSIGLRRLLAASTVVWASALFLGPLIASRQRVGVIAYVVSATIYEIGSLICHQRPERSFHLWGAQLPVCARCVGIYVGGAVAAVAAIASQGRGWQDSLVGRAMPAVLVGAIPSVVTLIYEWTTGVPSGNWTRSIAGFPLGAIVVWIIAGASSAGSRDTLTGGAR